MNKFRLSTVLCSILCTLATSLVAMTPAHADSQPINMPGTSSYYQFIDGSYSWEQANALASSTLYQGTRGHLVYINSSSENEFVASLLKQVDIHLHNAWIGGRDIGSVGSNSRVWQWGDSSTFTTCPTNGNTCVNSAFSSWDTVTGQPSGGGERYLNMAQSGLWNDCANLCGGVTGTGFVIEFELSGQPLLQSSLSAI